MMKELIVSSGRRPQGFYRHYGRLFSTFISVKILVSELCLG
jgi:hypothetical protein